MRKYNLFKQCTLILFLLFLTSCALFDKDNTPPPAQLTEFTVQASPRLLWSAHTGASVGKEFLKISPAVGEYSIFTAGTNGLVTSTNKADGQRNWQVNTHYKLTTGPGIGDGVVVIGGLHGEVVALRQDNGHEIWATSIPGEILATPVIANGVVVIKAIDGYVRGLDVNTGLEIWSFQQVEPNLVLRASSTPIICDHSLLIGFANGHLAKVNLGTGQIIWIKPIATAEGAFAIQRMIDIDADPIMFDHRVYVATYQGRIASLDWLSGKIIWSHDISSYTGMAADLNSVYISDAHGYIWSFTADSGLVNWRQTALRGRGVTGPATMEEFVVVGDAKGYLHWLDKRDGQFVARKKLGHAIFAAPIVENNVLYAINNQGYLVAYYLYRQKI